MPSQHPAMTPLLLMFWALTQSNLMHSKKSSCCWRKNFFSVKKARWQTGHVKTTDEICWNKIWKFCYKNRLFFFLIWWDFFACFEIGFYYPNSRSKTSILVLTNLHMKIKVFCFFFVDEKAETEEHFMVKVKLEWFFLKQLFLGLFTAWQR